MPATKGKRMIKISIYAVTGALVLFVSVFAVFYTLDVMRYSTLSDEFVLVSVGDTKSEVSLLLGEPNAVFPKEGPRFMFVGNYEGDVWIYGRTYTLREAFYLEPPFFYPYNFRFGPMEGDMVVEFDDDGRVVKAVQ